MTQQEIMEMRLWDYIDGIMPEQEALETAQLIRASALWKETYTELLLAHRTLAGMETSQPSMRFTQNVTEAIRRAAIAPRPQRHINTRVIRSVVLLFVMLIGVLLAMSIKSPLWQSEGSSGFQAGWFKSSLPWHVSPAGFRPYLAIGNIIAILFLLDALRLRRQQDMPVETS